MKSMLVLDTNSDIWMKKYSIKKNTIYLKPPINKEIPFQKIVYESQDINHEIIYDAVLQFAQFNRFNSFVVFNGNNNLNSIQTLITQTINITSFKSKESRLGVFEVRKDKIYDLQRGKALETCKRLSNTQLNEIYDVESTKQHHLVHVKHFQDIEKQLIFLPPNQQNLSPLTSFNRFFILEIDGCGKMVILNINDKLAFQKISKKQLDELLNFLIFKRFCLKENHTFSTILLKSLSVITEGKNLNKVNSYGYLISYYPSKEEHLLVAQKVVEKDQMQKLKVMLEDEEKFKILNMQNQIILFEEKINQLRIIRRVEEEKTSVILAKCKKIIDHMAEYLVFLNKHSIKNINDYSIRLQNDNKLKKNSLDTLQVELKHLNAQMITNFQTQEYFYDKILTLKNNLILKNKDRSSFVSKKGKQNVKHEFQPTSQNQLKCPQFEEMKDKIWNDLSRRIYQLEERKQFIKLMKELKEKVNQKQYAKVNQQYLYLFIE